jgi:hypothetical protein
MTMAANDRSQRTAALVCLLVSQAIYALSLLPWLLMVGFSVMAFDRPGSEQTWAPWLVVAAILTYPVWPVGFAATSWVLFARRKFTAATVVAVTPFAASIVLFAGLWIAEIMSAQGGLVVIEKPVPAPAVAPMEGVRPAVRPIQNAPRGNQKGF